MAPRNKVTDVQDVPTRYCIVLHLNEDTKNYCVETEQYFYTTTNSKILVTNYISEMHILLRHPRSLNN